MSEQSESGDLSHFIHVSLNFYVRNAIFCGKLMWYGRGVKLMY